MEFRTLEELEAYNQRVFEDSPLGQIQIQNETAFDLDGLSYFERITQVS